MGAFVAVGALAMGAACNSDADSGDTTPHNNTDNPSEEKPGATPGGGGSPQGEGTGTGRSDDTP